MRFAALSPNSTAARTAAPKTNATASHPKATLVEQSSQTFSETLDGFTETHHKVKLKMLLHKYITVHHTEHRLHKPTFKGV